MNVFERLESEVRGCCRMFPTVFTHARAHSPVDEAGRSYIDFFSGAGALNYGHNHPRLQQAPAGYLTDNGVVHAPDMMTAAKARLLRRFDEVILKPRGSSTRSSSPGPPARTPWSPR